MISEPHCYLKYRKVLCVYLVIIYVKSLMFIFCFLVSPTCRVGGTCHETPFHRLPWAAPGSPSLPPSPLSAPPAEDCANLAAPWGLPPSCLRRTLCLGCCTVKEMLIANSDHRMFYFATSQRSSEFCLDIINLLYNKPVILF